MTGIDLAIQLRWGDVDAFGHVNNVALVQLLEEARVRALVDVLGSALPSVLVAHQEIEYLAPLLYTPEPAVVRVWVSRIGKRSFTVAYHVLENASAKAELARAESTLVLVNLASGRATQIDDGVRVALEAVRGEPISFRSR